MPTLAPTPRHRAWPAALAALAFLGEPGAAAAATITGSLSFTAAAFPTGSPVDPISGVVSFSFDNSANFFNAAPGSIQNGAPVSVSIDAINLPGTWTPVLTYIRSGFLPGGIPVSDLMSIGHAVDGTNVLAGKDDWRVAVNTISGGPSFREFTYSQSGATVLYQTFSGTASPVPEPPASVLLAIGLLGAAARYRRRR